MSPKHYNNRYKKRKGTLKNWPTSFKNNNGNPFQSSSRLLIRASCSICRIIYTIFQLLIKSGYFNACYTHTQYSDKINSHYLNVNKFRDKVPLRNTLQFISELVIIYIVNWWSFFPDQSKLFQLVQCCCHRNLLRLRTRHFMVC